MAANTIPRWGSASNQDNTFRVATREYQTPSYAASIAIATNYEYTLVKVAQLTGALTLTINADSTCWVGDEIEFLFSVDGTNRTVTFGTGFAPSATLALTASKYGSATFRFNGTVWVETGREVTA